MGGVCGRGRTAHRIMAAAMLWIPLLLVAVPLLLLIVVRTCAARATSKRRRKWGMDGNATAVGFFHPYANAGGGGERVLWHSVAAMMARHSSLHCVIYTGDRGVTGEEILGKARRRFGIDLQDGAVHFVFMRWRWLVEASTWPRFTLAGQSLGSVLLGLEAFVRFLPDVYFDTMGYAFTYPLFRWLGGCRVMAYVHYPVVSTDMFHLVASGRQSYNNAGRISRSPLITRLKLCYYKLFAVLYGIVGRHAHIVMVNSSWTRGHIEFIWRPTSLHVVFPPCDTEAFSAIPRQPPADQFRVVSIGQYRPEKDHPKQLHALRNILDQRPAATSRLKLVIIGSCRDEGDRRRVEDLRSLAQELEVDGCVEFKVNITFLELQEELGSAHAALHTMWNEHFGIGLVECMAAGCVMVAHRSGGPLQDIVVEWEGSRTGFLAETADEFADCLLQVMEMSEEDRTAMASVGRNASSRFSVKSFERRLLSAVDFLL